MNTSAHRPQDRARRPGGRTGRVTVYLVAASGLLPLAVWVGSTGAQGTGPPEPREVVLMMPSEPSAGVPLFTLPWGDASGQVGVFRGTDEESRGPEAFAVAPDGRMAIVDSINHRLVLVTPEGAPLAEPTLTLRAPRFVAAAAERIYVLDADEDLAMITYSWEGDQLEETPVGPFDEPATALLLDASGLPLVECAHETTTPLEVVGTGSAERTAPRGRPAKVDARMSVNARMSRGQAHVEENEFGRGPVRGWQLSMDPGTRIDHLVSLDALPSGGVVVGVRAVPFEHRSPGSGKRPQPVDGEGALLISRIQEEPETLLLAEDATVYLGAPYVVGPDGSVYQPLATAEGYRIVRHAFPEVPK